MIQRLPDYIIPMSIFLKLLELSQMYLEGINRLKFVEVPKINFMKA
jgi:hypothetical protein